MKILVIMPAVPFPESGAEQMDRASGICQLVRLGFDVKVIAKRGSSQSVPEIEHFSKEIKVPILTVPYKYSNRSLTFWEKVKKILKKFLNPLYLDGAALEYSESEIQKMCQKEINNWSPDIIWFEYTYLWPLYSLAKKKKIPIITRSINYEPLHFLEEDGFSLMNILKSIPKFIGEQMTIYKSNLLFSITPKEEKLYKKLMAKKVLNLPLRGLPKYLDHKHEIRNRIPLKVFFMGSTYTVRHNLKAAEFVIKDVIPKLSKIAPGQFDFYILGKKLPSYLEALLTKNTEYIGYQNTLKFLPEMDIALIPSLFGAGMQQKIFESITLGIPTITSKRGIAHYPFSKDKDVCFGGNLEQFVKEIVNLKSIQKRLKLSHGAKKVAQKVFSQDVLDKIVLEGISWVLSNKNK